MESSLSTEAAELALVLDSFASRCSISSASDRACKSNSDSVMSVSEAASASTSETSIACPASEPSDIVARVRASAATSAPRASVHTAGRPKCVMPTRSYFVYVRNLNPVTDRHWNRPEAACYVDADTR